jgi:chromosome segregation ATPase
MADERIIELLEGIKKDIEEMKGDVKVIYVKLNNHDDRINILEKGRLETTKNCAEFIPKVKNVCKKVNEIEESHAKLKNSVITYLLGIVGTMGMMIFEYFRRVK